MHHHKLCIRQRLGQLQNLADMYSFPSVVIAAPGCHTVNISCKSCSWQCQELFPCQLKWIVNFPSNSQSPIWREPTWCALITQHRPFFCQVLSRWKTILPVRKLLKLCFRFFTKQLHEYITPLPLLCMHV